MNQTRVIAYVRVSTREQGDSGLGIAAQQTTIQREIEHRGWELVETFQDVSSGKSMRRRTGLAAACARLRAGDASVLLVAKLDRLSRSVGDFVALLERARNEKWAIVALDVAVDTTTAAGEMIANVLMVLAQWERRLISERTTAALTETRRRGMRLGRRPVDVPDEIRNEAWELRVGGLSLRAVAARLPGAAPGGGAWSAMAVREISPPRPCPICHVTPGFRLLPPYPPADADYPQPPKCNLCGATPQTVCADHDHASGRLRGFLCYGCNFALGLRGDRAGSLFARVRLDDQPKFLHAAIHYVLGLDRVPINPRPQTPPPTDKEVQAALDYVHDLDW